MLQKFSLFWGAWTTETSPLQEKGKKFSSDTDKSNSRNTCLLLLTPWNKREKKKFKSVIHLSLVTEIVLWNERNKITFYWGFFFLFRGEFQLALNDGSLSSTSFCINFQLCRELFYSSVPHWAVSRTCMPATYQPRGLLVPLCPLKWDSWWGNGTEASLVTASCYL